MLREIVSVCVVGAALAIGGCSHYKVTDPGSGKSYYTEYVCRHMGGGVSLTDARTGDKVTLQNSEVKEITKEEYMSNRIAK